jgi:hypothetical protein
MNNHELIPTLIGLILFIGLIIGLLEANKASNKAKRKENNSDRTIANDWHEMNDGSHYKQN